MSRVRWSVGAGALLAAALVYFFDDSGLVAAVAPAAAVHELGHILALRALRRRLTRVRVALSGVELDYAPALEGAKCALCALAGPLAGIAYAVAACTLGGEYFRLSGAASFLLSCFNLLPALPLDGGRAMAALLPERAARIVSRLTAAAVLLAGTLLAARGGAPVPAAMGLWLCACGAVKSRDAR